MSQQEDGTPNPSDLDKLDARLREARGDQDIPQASNSRGTSIGLAFRLTTELVAGLVVGGAIGWGLDYVLGTTPWMLLLFFLLGMAAGILNVLRTAQEMNRRHAAQNETTRSEDE